MFSQDAIETVAAASNTQPTDPGSGSWDVDTEQTNGVISFQLTEQEYWVVVQALSAAGTASHRHGMEKHAKKFHEVEKQLYDSYEG